MNFLDITIGDIVIRLASADSAGAVIPAFVGAQVFERGWDGKTTPKACAPSFAFVDPTTTVENPAVAAARQEAATNEKRWFATIEERDKLKKRVAELEAAHVSHVSV